MTEINKVTGLTDDQQKLAEERREKGLCPACGYAEWFCGGVERHLRKQRGSKIR